MVRFNKTITSALLLVSGLSLCACDDNYQANDAPSLKDLKTEELSERDLNTARQANETAEQAEQESAVAKVDDGARGTSPFSEDKQTQTLQPTSQHQTVFFEGQETSLSDQEESRLEEFANEIKQADLSEQEIAVVAYSPSEVSPTTEAPEDGSGDVVESSEAKLAIQRAETVKNYLQEQGVHAANWNVETMTSFNSSTMADSTDTAVIVSIRRYYRPMGEQFD